jgi:CHC2 zinc finger
MKTTEILSRLKGVRQSRQGWIAQCPAHEDRSPSLSIREGNGKALLHCFAGCTIEAICAATGIRVSDLFAEQCPPRKPEPPIVRTVER